MAITSNWEACNLTTFIGKPMKRNSTIAAASTPTEGARIVDPPFTTISKRTGPTRGQDINKSTTNQFWGMQGEPGLVPEFSIDRTQAPMSDDPKARVIDFEGDYHREFHGVEPQEGYGDTDTASNKIRIPKINYSNSITGKSISTPSGYRNKLKRPYVAR